MAASHQARDIEPRARVPNYRGSGGPVAQHTVVNDVGGLVVTVCVVLGQPSRVSGRVGVASGLGCGPGAARESVLGRAENEPAATAYKRPHGVGGDALGFGYRRLGNVPNIQLVIAGNLPAGQFRELGEFTRWH